ncbi:MAG: GMC family oxidoreductase N-terminal domain-containing protein [SAR324 cluster bacterium]
MTRIVHDAATLDRDLTLDCDVAVIGTGAGGGTAAEILALAGLRVVMLEEGAYLTAKDFTLRESDASTEMYFDGGSRTTKDGTMTILQGRTVGGSTTVNWTASFRAPAEVLGHWGAAVGVRGVEPETLAPWFDRVEKRLHVAPWAIAPNANNEALARGCKALGFVHGVIPRNVDRCLNLGTCGLGCPVNAKRSMLVTTVPGALDAGAVLVTRCRAERVSLTSGKAAGVEAVALDARGVRPTGRKVTVQARHVVASGGGINTPGLLLRSRLPDPHAVLGKRAFTHIVNSSAAILPETVDGFQGAPQSVYSKHFLFRDGLTGKAGYSLEAAPVYPVLAMSVTGRAGHELLSQWGPDFRHVQSLIALVRDGFHEQSQGGVVEIRSDGSPVLDYPVTDYLWEALYHAYLRMAEIQFAAGARAVMPIHTDASPYRSWSEAKVGIPNLPARPFGPSLFSAHLMGGCAMGEDPKRSVVNSLGRHHQVEGLSVIDASVFPTGLGVNPQMTTYAISARNATRLAEDLGGKPKPAAA